MALRDIAVRMGDAIGSLKGQIGNQWSNATAKIAQAHAQAADAYEAGKQAAQAPAQAGVRAAPVATGTGVVPYDPAVGQAHGPVIQQPVPPGANPNIPNGGMSQEAQAFTGANKGAFTPAELAAGGTPPTGGVPPAGGVMSRIRGALPKASLGVKATGLAAVAGEAMDPNVRDAVNPDSNLSMTDRLRQGARSALRVGGGILGGAAGSAFMPIAGTAAGGYAGYKAGDWVADRLVGPEGPSQVRGAPAKPAQEQPQTGSIPASDTPQTASMRASKWNVPKLGTDDSTMPSFINGKQYEVPKGGMLIKNNQTGTTHGYQVPDDPQARINELEQKIGGNDAYNQVRNSGVAASSGSDLGSGSVVSQGIRGMANLGVAGAMSRIRMNEGELAAKRAAAGYGIYKDQRDFEHTNQNENQKRFDKIMHDRAVQSAGEPSMLPGGKEKFEATVAANEAANREKYRHTLENMGKTDKTASDSDLSKLHMLDDLQAKLKASRETWRNKYGAIGNVKYDSRDLNDMQPEHYENAPFGRWLVLKSGERVPMTHVAGGGWNVFGPNDPADKQIVQMANKADAEYNKTHKGK